MSRRTRQWALPLLVTAVVTSGLTAAGVTVQLAATSDGQQVDAASRGGSDLQRCAVQVSDTAKQLRPVGGVALDTGNFTGHPAGASAASAVPTHRVYGGAMSTVWDAPQTNDASYLGANATVTSADTGTAQSPLTSVFGTFVHTPDVPAALPEVLTATSTNAGQSWPLPATVAQDLPSFTVPLRDGRLLALGFKPISSAGASAGMTGTITDSTGNPATATDVGVTFQDFYGASGSPMTWLRTGGKPIQRSDGAVLLPLYGGDITDARDAKHSAVSLGIATPPTGTGAWVFRPLRPNMAAPLSSANPATTIGADLKSVNFTEMALLERPGGSIIGIIRNLVQAESSGSDPMVWTSSADGGVSWSPRTTLKGTLAGWNGNGSPQPGGVNGGAIPGVNPQLDLLTNGMIVLSAGKPDNWIAASKTGSATDWSGQYTYRNCPTTAVIPSTSYKGYRNATTPATDPDQWRYGSSGNTSVVNTGSNRVLQFGDNCHNYHWGCVRTSAQHDANGDPVPGTFKAQTGQSPYTVDLTSRIWQRQVDVVTGNVGKLDLAAMLASGQASVSGNMTFSAAAHPRAGLRAAFDGSRSYWSSAIASGAPGTLTLDLGKTYTLNRVGLGLRPQLPESATVKVSTDNVTWSTITSAYNATSAALAYTDIAPVAARYVTVTVPAVSGCDTGLAATCAFLNELELYSTVDGFENDPWGNYPRGADAASQVWVTKDTSGGSHQALRLWDQNSGVAQASFPAASGVARTLTFRLKPVSWASNAGGGFLFSLDSGATGALRLAIFKDGTLHAYSNGSYGPTLGVTSVPVGSWSTIMVTRTNSTSATVRVGSGPAVAVPAAAAATTVDGYTFASSGSAPTGDQVLIDDVEYH